MALCSRCPSPPTTRKRSKTCNTATSTLANVVAGITNGRMSGLNLIHLDPDLNFDTYQYRKDRPAWQQWRGMLGQAGIAQSHLNKQGDGDGVVILFFGLCR